jgi:hypothetical protein
MSPRAAWRLETLGFEHVYDYVPGKADWLAAGLLLEGTGTSVPRAGDVARSDATTCALDARLGEAREQARAASLEVCLVLTESGVVLGRLRAPFDGDPASLVEETMESGPTTVRADEPLEALVPRMQARATPSVIVTSPDGVLVGTLSLEDAERRLEEGSGAATPEEGPSCACGLPH